MTKWALFCDLDGTLLDDKERITAEDQKAIDDFIQAGHLFVPITGRMERDIHALVLNPLRLDVPLVISQNGCVVTYRQATVLVKQFAPTLMERIVPALRAYHEAGFEVHVSTQDTEFTPRAYHSHGKSQVLSHFFEDVVTKPLMRVLLRHETPKLEQAQTELQRLFGEECQVLLTGATFLDLIPLNASKGDAILFCKERAYLPSQYMAAIGDSENDLSMFQEVEHSFAHASARPPIQKAARFTVASVAQCIQRLMQSK